MPPLLSPPQGRIATEEPARRAGVNLAAVAYFLFAGGLALLDSFEPLWLTASVAFLLALTAGALPWHRWPATHLLALAAAAMGLQVLAALEGWTLGERETAVVTTLLVLVAIAWVGFTQPRRTALVFAVAAAAAMVAIKQIQGPLLPWATLAAVPVGALLAEIAAYVMSDLRSAHRRAGDLGKLSRSFTALRTGGSVDDAAEMVGRLAQDIFDSPWALVVWQIEDGFGPLVTVGAHPPEPATSLVEEAKMQLGALTGPSGHGGESIAVPATIELDVGERATTMIPLNGRDGLVGAVLIDPARADLIGGDRPRSATAADRATTATVTELFSVQAGTAIEQFRKIQGLAQAAFRDPLTGMGNRRHAAALLDSLNADDAVILIDLDAFKQVNDSYGHLAGDGLLQDLSSYLQSFVRNSDELARFGGDEFIVVARHSGASVRETSERMMNGWRETTPRTSISVGVTIPVRGEAGDATLQRADAALYQAKKAGRNCVVFDHPERDNLDIWSCHPPISG